MTDTDIHSCGYYCDRPLCIKAQRDELREKMYVKKEWVGLTNDEAADFVLFHAVVDEECVRAIEAKLKEKNNG